MLRLFAFVLFLSTNFAIAQEIAITFDDAPTSEGPLFSGAERTEKILNHLSNQKVKEVAFFILTGNINARNSQRLTRYTKAGHLLANHTHRHKHIHEIGTMAYIRDVAIADSILKLKPGFRNWFRYPFLDEGKSVSVRDSLREGIKNLGLINGYVTIDNYDWYLNNLVKQATQSNKKINENKLGQLYIDHVYNSILFYDKVARQNLGRSPKHVLLLHENDLAALYLGDLIMHLQKKGWKIISTVDAYMDPIATHAPDVLFNGQGRVAAIAREKGIPARDLVQISEDEEYLDKLVKDSHIFE
ncbi:MAG: polysaccharide deacetylase family protein [Cyclobacteriaceae bacterium]